MKKNVVALFLVFLALTLAGCGKKSGVEGKVVDGRGKPMSGVKLIAKQVEPIKGYEQFETTTASDGTFRFKKLFPTSEYEIIPWFDDWSVSPRRTLGYEVSDLRAMFNQNGWTTRRKMVVRSGPEGQTIMLKSPVKILQTISTVIGKVVDGRGKPMSGVKLIAKQVKPIKGYEQFETTTASDGTFRFDKMFPFADYLLIPTSDAWKADARKEIQTTGDEQTVNVVVAVRFTSANGVVTDTKTSLMWASRDNGRDINWANAKAYCDNYKAGGFSDWRLPTQDELAELYKAGIRNRKNQIISLSSYCLWTSETSGSKAAYFNFSRGYRYWDGQFYSGDDRALPVRSGK